ncbi:MAG: polyprenyl synthetase family protein [Nitrospirae bacterium]|nr:polyprenyl synthetase family protein [Nitrospirota bacterium]
MIIVKTKANSILSAYLLHNKDTIDRYLMMLDGISEDIPATLYESMHYSLSAGGKRIRPILAIASCEAVGGTIDDVIPAAIAIEMIHTYSLIHDDLPSMDNDDLRRGKPANHKVFGEATAILAGDGLLTMAFGILSDTKSFKNQAYLERRLKIIREIAVAAGPDGMVGGQQLDIENEGKKIDIVSVEKLHNRKTGALILAAIRTGGISGGASELQLQALTDYGKKTGLAFQIADDILDVEGKVEDVGKSIGKDANQRKNTYPALLGLEQAKNLAGQLVSEAITALDSFDDKADPLRLIAAYAIDRKS